MIIAHYKSAGTRNARAEGRQETQIALDGPYCCMTELLVIFLNVNTATGAHVSPNVE